MTNATSTTTSRTMTFDSQLIEDFLHTDDILVDASTAEPLAVFMNNQGDSEALVISKNSRGNDELYHVCREPLSDSGWNVYGIGAYASAIAVVDSNTVWAVGTDQQLWQNQTGRWSQQVATLPGGAAVMPVNLRASTYFPISIGTDGVVWAVDGGGNLYKYDAGGDQWEPSTGPSHLTQAPVGTTENLWALTGQYYEGELVGNQIVQYAGGSWQTPQFPAMPQQVCVGADESVWAVDQQGNLYQYVSAQWQQSRGTPNLYVVAVVAANDIWGISQSQSRSGLPMTVVHYDGSTWQTVSQAPVLKTTDKVVNLIPQISVAADGTVWCVDQDGIVWKLAARSGSSWQRQMMPTGMSGATATGNVTEVAVGQDSSGLQGFYIQGGIINQAFATAVGTWGPSEPFTPTGCTGLGITNQQDTGALIAYASNGAGNMVVVKLIPNTEFYTSSEVNANGILKDAKLQITAQSDDAWFTAAVIGGALCVQWGTATAPLTSTVVNLPPGLMFRVTQSINGNAPTNLKEVIRLPWFWSPAGYFYCAAVDLAGNIWMVFNISVDPSNTGMGSFIPLTGPQAITPSPLSAVKSTSALIDSSSLARIYATDANDKLWVVRQTGLSGNSDSPWTWTAWHPLGDNCLYLANGPGTQATRDLFTIDADSFLIHLSQDPANLNWSAAQLRKPCGVMDEPYYVSQYVTEITVLDSGGNPEPNVPVTVSVADPVSVWVSDVQYNLDSSHSAQFITNPMGKVTLSTLALDLHTAQLSFQADGFANPYSVYAPQNVQSRLAGVDGPSLQGAQARTQSVPTEVNTPLVSSKNQPTCGSAAAVIQGVFKMKSDQKINPGVSTGFSADGAAPTYEAIRALWAAKVIEVQPLATSTAGGAEELGSWDSFWDDLKDFGEDVWHGIRKGILTVEKIELDTVNAAIKVTMVLAEVGKATIHFFIKTIDDVVHAVAAAFRWLGAEIEKAIDWLKEFFSWGDIINTKTVIEHYLNQVFSNLITDLDPTSPNSVQQLVSSQFQNLITMIAGDKAKPGSDAFAQAHNTFGAQSFTGSVSHVSVAPNIGSNALQPDGVHNTYSAHQVKCNYAHRKTETYVHQGGTLSPTNGAGGAMATLTGSFEGFLESMIHHLDAKNPKSPYSLALANLQENMKGAQSKGLFDKAITEFLDLVKEFVLVVITLIEEIVLELLNMAAQCLVVFQGTLNHQLHIPVISWLYEKISHHPLTLLDLFCLIVAIPVTLIYKLIWGGSNASPPFTSEQVKAIIAQPISWPQIQGSGLGTSLSREGLLGAEQASALSIVLGVMSLLNAVLYALVDAGTDIETINGPGESGYPLTTFLSGLAIFLTAAGMGWGVPYEALEKTPEERSKADNCAIACWGMGGLGLALNIVSLVASKRESMAKYWDFWGPISVTVLGLVPFGFGIYSAVEFSKPNSGYDAVASAGAIITPIPSMFKFLLLPHTEPPLLFLVPLDFACDFASGLLTFVEGIDS